MTAKKVYASYDDIPSEEFSDTVNAIALERGAEWIMALPGVHEVLREELNNEALDVLCPEPLTIAPPAFIGEGVFERFLRYEGESRRSERGIKFHAFACERSGEQVIADEWTWSLTEVAEWWEMFKEQEDAEA